MKKKKKESAGNAPTLEEGKRGSVRKIKPFLNERKKIEHWGVRKSLASERKKGTPPA